MAKHVRIYTTPMCGYCMAAKRMLAEKGIAFEETNLAGDPELRAKISTEAGGWSTVPMIFVGDHFVGGFQELAGLHRQNKLMDLVKPSSSGVATCFKDRLVTTFMVMGGAFTVCFGCFF